MVDPLLLTNDVVGNVAGFALPPALWLFLYLFAWEREDFAQSVGFGRTAFWLLLPGSLLGFIANLPFLQIGGDVLAVNIGGGIVPIVLATVLFGRAVGNPLKSIILFLGSFAVESGALLVAVLRFPDNPLGIAGLFGVAATVPTVLLVLSAISPGARGTLLRRTGLFSALASAALLATFFTSQTVPGLGIVSAFPLYLLAPLIIGVVAVLLIRDGFDLPDGLSLPLAYGASTFGVLIGADLLRQPPLYGPGSSGIFAIGGAGILDLLYLTGLVGLASSYLMLRLSGRASGPRAPETVGPASTLTPAGRLREAYYLGLFGKTESCLRESSLAAREAVDQARLLQGLGPASAPTLAWDGLHVPPWVASDQANLEALAARGSSDRRDSLRAWMTARWLVRVGREAGRQRFATGSARLYAFALDLLLVTAPAVLVWDYLAATIPGTLSNVLSSPAFNAAAFGYAAWAFVYFAVAEALFGTTLGKRMFRLVVRNRALEPPGIVPVLVRAAPKLVPLSIIGVGGALAIALLLRGRTLALNVPSSGVLSHNGFLALFSVLASVALGVGLCALIGLLGIATSSENQRLGDLLAGTWVVRSVTDAVPPPGAQGLAPEVGRSE